MSGDMNLVWLTDIHLNFVENSGRQAFYQSVKEALCDAVVISGDIADATCVEDLLKEFADSLQKPIYFVLGNHDYYHGTIKDVRMRMQALSHAHPFLFYLPQCGQKLLTDEVILLGVDGWADGRYGDFNGSTVHTNGSRFIGDLIEAGAISKTHLLRAMQLLADGDVSVLKAQLLQAICKRPKQIIIVTHVPPFKEACLFHGKPAPNDHLPYFSSQATGKILKLFAQNNPDIAFLVLSGHTHDAATYQPSHNLRICVGHAEYGKPDSRQIIALSSGRRAATPR